MIGTSEVWDGKAIFHGGVQARGGQARARSGCVGGASRPGSGSSENVLRKWVRDAKSSGSQAFPGRGKQRPDDAEVSRLKRELAKTQAERDIIKKAIAFFAKEKP